MLTNMSCQEKEEERKQRKEKDDKHQLKLDELEKVMDFIDRFRSKLHDPTL